MASDRISDMDNRRRFERIDRELLASYTHFDPGDREDDEGMAKTLNLSVGGVLLLLAHSFEQGTRLELALNLDGQVIEVVGKVAHCEASAEVEDMFDVGVELESTQARYAEAVERFFAKA
jgi:hypothetical protein